MVWVRCWLERSSRGRFQIRKWSLLNLVPPHYTEKGIVADKVPIVEMIPLLMTKLQLEFQSLLLTHDDQSDLFKSDGIQILIEQQPTLKAKNYALAAAVQSFFELQKLTVKRIKSIQLISSSHKLTVMNSDKTSRSLDTHYKRKQASIADVKKALSIQTCYRATTTTTTTKNGNDDDDGDFVCDDALRWKQWLQTREKMDDLCDCLLQALWWYSDQLEQHVKGSSRLFVEWKEIFQ